MWPSTWWLLIHLLHSKSIQKLKACRGVCFIHSIIHSHELFGKDGYYNIELSDLTSHLNEMVPIEKAATLLHSDTLSKDATTESSSQFREQSEKLLAAHTKTIALSKIRIHRPSQNIRSFQYLAEDSTFNSTVSTRILAEEWTIDKTPAKDMEYKIFDEDSIPRKETFLLASSMKRRKSVSFTPDMGLPTISLTAPLNGEANFLKGESVSMELNDIPMIVSTQDGVNDSQHLTPQISSQVLPGRFGARVVKKPASKKKKKQKTSGFK
jgi:hypothetical protein